MFSGLVKIRFIQLERFSKICVSSVINCLRPCKVIRESNSGSSQVAVSLMDQLVDLVLKSPVIRTKYGLRLDLSATSFLRSLSTSSIRSSLTSSLPLILTVSLLDSLEESIYDSDKQIISNLLPVF